VLAAVISLPILAEYEEAVAAAGYLPGAVLPSGLAALRAIRSSEPVLSACFSECSLTTAITRGDDVLLYRAHELPEEHTLRLSDLRRDVAVAAAYFEDKVLTSPQCLSYAGTSTAAEFARTLAFPGLSVVDLAPRSDKTTSIPPESTSIAGVNGALAGAR
jgi:type IV pilus assembly protein PilM